MGKIYLIKWHAKLLVLLLSATREGKQSKKRTKLRTKLWLHGLEIRLHKALNIVQIADCQ